MKNLLNKLGQTILGVVLAAPIIYCWDSCNHIEESISRDGIKITRVDFTFPAFKEETREGKYKDCFVKVSEYGDRRTISIDKQDYSILGIDYKGSNPGPDGIVDKIESFDLKSNELDKIEIDRRFIQEAYNFIWLNYTNDLK